MEYFIGVILGKEYYKNVFQMATDNFLPTQLTYQTRIIANLINFCIFHPILINNGGANVGLTIT